MLLTISVINFGDSKEIINNAPQLSEKRKFIYMLTISGHSYFGKPSVLRSFLKESLVHG